METRNVILTLEKAREWYNSGSSDLKEVALQAYTVEELTIPEWKNIKTFEDAVKALGIHLNNVLFDISYMKKEIEGKLGKHLIAIYKLDIIRKALNGNWKPNLVQGSVYYPYIKLYPANQKAKEVASSNNWKLGKSFIADGKKYALVGGGCYSFSCGGLADFDYGSGNIRPSRSLLGCKNKEIAEHMSSYFSKEIFEAIYAQHINTYEWIN